MPTRHAEKTGARTRTVGGGRLFDKMTAQQLRKGKYIENWPGMLMTSAPAFLTAGNGTIALPGREEAREGEGRTSRPRYPRRSKIHGGRPRVGSLCRVVHITITRVGELEVMK
jgi:hypothetical protein